MGYSDLLQSPWTSLRLGYEVALYGYVVQCGRVSIRDVVGT
jgi:hypothetical protein